MRKVNRKADKGQHKEKSVYSKVEKKTKAYS